MFSLSSVDITAIDTVVAVQCVVTKTDGGRDRVVSFVACIAVHISLTVSTRLVF